MDTVLKDFPETPEAVPDRIITRFINKESGELTQSGDPDGYSEYFLSGTEPQNIVQPLVTRSGNESQSGGGESGGEETGSLF